MFRQYLDWTSTSTQNFMPNLSGLFGINCVNGQHPSGWNAFGFEPCFALFWINVKGRVPSALLAVARVRCRSGLQNVRVSRMGTWTAESQVRSYWNVRSPVRRASGCLHCDWRRSCGISLERSTRWMWVLLAGDAKHAINVGRTVGGSTSGHRKMSLF